MADGGGAAVKPLDQGERLARLETLVGASLTGSLSRLEGLVSKINDRIEGLQRLEQQHLDGKAALERAFGAISTQRGRVDDLERDMAARMGWLRGAYFALSIIATVGSSVLVAGGGYIASRALAADQEILALKAAAAALGGRLDRLEKGQR